MNKLKQLGIALLIIGHTVLSSLIYNNSLKSKKNGKITNSEYRFKHLED